MLTVVETPLFQKQWPHYWDEEDRGEFAAYIAENPGAGVVVAEEEVVLLTLYAKAKTDNLTASKLKEIRRALES
jgi:hypothetical protein